MPATYYTHPTAKYPETVLAILERLRLYYCTLFFPDELYATSKDRFILTDITPNMALRGSVNMFKISNAKFPFTAYSIGDFEEDTQRMNSFAKTSNYYSSIHSALIHASPIIQTFPMISFFSTNKDYDRAKIILLKEKSLPIKLTVPITINGTLTSFTILVDFDVARGSYAGEFEQQLVAGNLYDLVHTTRVHYHQLVLNTTIHAVDDIIVSLRDLDSKEKATKTILSTWPTIPSTPIISSTDPADEATNVDVASSIIINFNVAMNETSVEDALGIVPPVDADLLWNTASTQLVVDLYTNMVSGTAYVVTVEDTARSGEEIPIEEDYTFEFTTV